MSIVSYTEKVPAFLEAGLLNTELNSTCTQHSSECPTFLNCALVLMLWHCEGAKNGSFRWAPGRSVTTGLAYLALFYTQPVLITLNAHFDT